MVTSRSLFAPLLCALALPLVACGDDNGSPGTTSTATTTTQSDATTTESDTAGTTSEPDVSEPDVVLPAGCDFNSFASEGSFEPGSAGALFSAVSQKGNLADVLSIEIYLGAEYPDGATGPGTYDLDDPNYRTCANCVRVRHNCPQSGACESVFFVDEGQMVIETWDAQGGTFSGHLVGAKAKEVTIDANTYDSTLVPNGQVWCLDGYEFTAEIKALPVSDKTQPNCVEEGTGHLLHDNVANLTLMNCLGEPVELHATCGGESKALWLIGTAGWCQPCHDFLEGFRKQHTATGTLTRERIGTKTPGLDMLIFLAEDLQGLKPDQEFCMELAEDLKIDPSMIVLDWTDGESEIPLIEPEGSYLPTHALGNIWKVVNPYLKASLDGSVTTAYPWWALLRATNMEYIWSDGGQLMTFDAALESLLGEFPAELFD